MKSSNGFTGGKLRFKNPKLNSAYKEFKSEVKKDLLNRINEKKDIEYRIYQEIKESLDTKSQEVLVDRRTAAEKRFDELRVKRISERIKKEEDPKQENKERFKRILDKQTEHYDVPKVGGG